LNPTDRVIDGIHLENVPHRNKTAKKMAGSNLNHGGIWYGVSLEVRPRVYLEDVFLLPSAPSGELTVKVTLSEPPKSENASLTVSVRDSSRSDAVVAKGGCSLPCDATEAEVKVTVPTPRLWSLESPSLYPVEVLLSTPEGEDRITQKTGFRTFELQDGYFYLNGKRLFLKSAHTGNAFPVGQMHPVYPDQMRRDMIYAKASGFQMLRAISGMFRPEQIALADEIGLLLYEECFASWCLGNSQSHEWSDETYEEISWRDPLLPLGDQAAMLRRWRKIFPSTEEMSTYKFYHHRGGVTLRCDSATNLSPALYREFAMPYDALLYKRFGGGAMHFCGKGDHYIEALSETPGLYGINMSQPHLNDMETIYRNTVDKGIKILGLGRAEALRSKDREGGFHHCVSSFLN
jgi:hypothetical protein